MTPQPIGFNDVRGENIRLSQDKSKAVRYESFNQALCFTDRPLVVNERLQVIVTEVSRVWSGTLRVGLTIHNPLTFKHNLPKFCCPDLTMRPGFWGKAVPEANAKHNQSFCIHYNKQGQMMFELPDGRSEVFLSGLDVSRPLYAIFDIYGNTKAIQIGVGQPWAAEASGSGATAVATTPVTETFSACTLKPCELIQSDGVVKTNGRYATKSSPAGCGLAVTQRSVAARETFIIKIGQFHDHPKNVVRFALTNEAPANLTSLDSIEKLFDSTDYTVTFSTEMIESSELAVTIDENGDVFESVDPDSWKFLVHVDENVPFHFVVEMSAMKDLEILGTTKELIPIKPETPPGAKVRAVNHFDEERLCIVCLEGDRSMLLEPCHHFVLCETCSKALKGDKCPLCRTPIRQVKRIFMS